LSEVVKITHRLGAQAVIASIPIKISSNNDLFYFDYLNNKTVEFNKSILNLLSDKMISEVLLIDVINEGKKESFNFDIINFFPIEGVPLILFGGLSSTELLNKGLSSDKVSAVSVGNSLNYSEHSIQRLKSDLGLQPIRPAMYQQEAW
jgi:imidazole glycerol phosphate synthase subunit HisF